MDSHFLPADKLHKSFNKKIDPDVVKGVQSYAEKVIADVINRSALLTRHCERDIIDASEISVIVEKDFDCSFGLRTIIEEVNQPSSEHIERMVEINRQK